MVSRDAILDVLRTINDPEMPVSIVDLGIVEDVRADGEPAGRVEIELGRYGMAHDGTFAAITHAGMKWGRRR